MLQSDMYILNRQTETSNARTTFTQFKMSHTEECSSCHVICDN